MSFDADGPNNYDWASHKSRPSGDVKNVHCALIINWLRVDAAITFWTQHSYRLLHITSCLLIRTFWRMMWSYSICVLVVTSKRALYVDDRLHVDAVILLWTWGRMPCWQGDVSSLTCPRLRHMNLLPCVNNADTVSSDKLWCWPTKEIMIELPTSRVRVVTSKTCTARW